MLCSVYTSIARYVIILLLVTYYYTVVVQVGILTAMAIYLPIRGSYKVVEYL